MDLPDAIKDGTIFNIIKESKFIQSLSEFGSFINSHPIINNAFQLDLCTSTPKQIYVTRNTSIYKGMSEQAYNDYILRRIPPIHTFNNSAFDMNIRLDFNNCNTEKEEEKDDNLGAPLFTKIPLSNTTSPPDRKSKDTHTHKSDQKEDPHAPNKGSQENAKSKDSHPDIPNDEENRNSKVASLENANKGSAEKSVKSNKSQEKEKSGGSDVPAKLKSNEKPGTTEQVKSQEQLQQPGSRDNSREKPVSHKSSADKREKSGGEAVSPTEANYEAGADPAVPPEEENAKKGSKGSHTSEPKNQAGEGGENPEGQSAVVGETAPAVNPVVAIEGGQQPQPMCVSPQVKEGEGCCSSCSIM